ncbi:hypothetical protein [Cytobacillus massiliigabonensis]|uniref:hypothetical protein n=1 Tax=Cytobacillus massiliigabonensis TaxID=1871011 RepID=UPI0015E11C01|nr:hypothetical protein [Cytobacillus massiliigabonensis]
MRIPIWIFLIIITLYSIGFTVTLWRDKKKLGSIAVFSLAAATVVSALIGVLK